MTSSGPLFQQGMASWHRAFSGPMAPAMRMLPYGSEGAFIAPFCSVSRDTTEHAASSNTEPVCPTIYFCKVV